MNYGEIQDAVLSDRFNETQRADAQRWINHRYWWIWSLEPWTFRQATDAVTITAGSQTVTGIASPFLHAHSLLDDSGEALEAIGDPRTFFERYSDPVETGVPEAFCVVGTSILVGPTPSETATYTLLYEKEYTALDDDADEPGLPEGAHFALVHGGAAEGLKLQNDPTWQAFEDDFQATITVLRQNYLVAVKGSAQQFGAYRPGDQWV